MRWEIAASPWPSVEEIEHRFDELIRGRWIAGAPVPAADVFVADEFVWIEIDLPGVDERDVHVRAEQGFLWIEATRRPRGPSETARAARVERPRGALRRAIPVPREVAAEPPEVALEAGVLRVRLRLERQA